MNPKSPGSHEDKKPRELDISFELTICDGPGDNTIRPARPEIPRHWVRPRFPKVPPQDEERPEKLA